MLDKMENNDSIERWEDLQDRGFIYYINGKYYEAVPIVEAEKRTCTCWTCDKTLDVGDEIQYDTRSYTTYCDNTYCTEGVATCGTCLEDCWWGDFEDDVYVDEQGNILLDDEGSPRIVERSKR